jgi:hypothetical protein
VKHATDARTTEPELGHPKVRLAELTQLHGVYYRPAPPA